MSTATLETPPALGATPGGGLRKFKNNLATVLITASFCIALIPLVLIMKRPPHQAAPPPMH